LESKVIPILAGIIAFIDTNRNLDILASGDNQDWKIGIWLQSFNNPDLTQLKSILEDTGHCQNMSIADTGRFWEILVIPVLQILENTGYTSIADIGRLGRIPVTHWMCSLIHICIRRQ
jgi:hypothetical protein